MLERTTRSYVDGGPPKEPARPPCEEEGGGQRRTRRPRVPALQSGYCAVCSVPYNSVQDHLRSKKHRKLIGGDANYIALNGSLNGFLQSDAIPFLNLNGVDAIGVHDSSFDEFPPKCKRRAAARTRAGSVPGDVDGRPGHQLRSRKSVNYASPPSDDEGGQGRPRRDGAPPGRDCKEYRELRSSTKALAKLTEQVTPSADQEVWNSGRPKRACINKKRPSTEEPFTPNSKTFYKVEVVPSKPAQKGAAKRQPSRDDDKDKALIVKFRKMRNSELVRLNDEATNFLFPQREDSGSEAEDASEVMSCSDVGDCDESSRSFKVEDDRSMDSTSSSTKGKKKRRTHAEAFIMDNQKYYKFETPGSRLRYHGSYLPAVPKSPKFNGAFSAKPEEPTPEEPDEKKIKYNPDAKVKLENYKFSFEKVPTLASWYEPFRRIDKGEQAYIEFSDYFLDPFLLPYQMPAIPPLDPRVCLGHYAELRKRLSAPAQRDTRSRSPTPEAGRALTSPPSSFAPDHDDDSKLSVATASSTSSAEDEHRLGGNPRKSPRQHASTLAMLGGGGSLPPPRRRQRAKKAPSLDAIPEEVAEPQVEKPKTPARKAKPRVDYHAIARQIDQELDNALDDGLENYDLDVPVEQTVDFVHSRCSLAEIMRLYDEGGSSEGGRRTAGRKPGRRKKTNRTGWPSKSRRASKRKEDGGGGGNTETDESDEDDDRDGGVAIDEGGVDNGEGGEAIDEGGGTIDEGGGAIDEGGGTIDEGGGATDEGGVSNGELRLQPYVCVRKLDSGDVVGERGAPKRTKRRLRHMPGSPKSPRVLRKPRGRWYRER